MENFLKPLERKNRLKRHAVFDIESNRWTEFEMAGFYDGRTYTFCPTLDSLMDEILSKKNRGRAIFAHNGGRFDFLFLFDYLQKTGRKISLITQGPRVTALKIDIGDRHYVTLQDSYALLPHSLDKLCETFKPSTVKMRGAIDFENERVDSRNPKHRDYLRADCESLWQVLDKYRQLPFVRDVGFKLTLASTAMSAWRTTLKNPIRTTPDHVQSFVRQAYAGGRCEIFRQVMEGGHCFDVNSLYPTMMLKPLPVEYIGESNDPDEFGFHDVTVEVPDTYMPILWVKTPKLVFPTGKFRGTFFSEELRLALQCGARILRFHRGARFESRTDLFTSYIGECYQMRRENPGSSLDLLGKMLMNNTYGKFAERELKKSLVKINQLDPSQWPAEFQPFHSDGLFKKTGLVQITKYKRTAHMLCHIAAAITAWGRVHMAENLYLPKQSEIRYTDTDSAYITSKIPTSPDLGRLKLEYSIKSGFFLLPKGYFIETTDGKIIRKLKGFSKKSLESITSEMFKRGNISVTETKLAGFRTALIRKNCYLALLDQKKSVISEYNKRKILQGGETRPWHLREGKLI